MGDKLRRHILASAPGATADAIDPDYAQLMRDSRPGAG
jgi:hypothetical protein